MGFYIITMLRIFIGILIIIAGIIVTLKNDWLLRHFGRINWAEDHLGFEGGTRLFYKMLGIIICFLGIFVATGIWNDILGAFTKIFIRR